MTRGRVAALVAAAIVGAAALGLLAGRLIESPADAASKTRPPEASPITVPVERRRLVASIVTRGTARAGDLQEVSLAAGARAPGLVTVPPEQGNELTEGSVAMEVDGAPVFVFHGERPMYRDIGPGDSGPDVRQLEEALERLGLRPGHVDGVYDRATESAVARLYDRAGYAPPKASEEDRQALRQADEAVEAAATRVREAERRLAEQQKPPTDLDRLTAETAVTAARDALSSSARASNAAIADAWRAMTEAEEAFNSATGADVEKTYQALLAARRAYDDAQANATASQRRAESDLAVAEARLRALQAPADTAAEQAVVADAAAALARATEDRDRLAARSGAVVRASSVVFAAALPARIETAHVQRGAAASGKAMTLANSSLSVDASVSTADARQLAAGQRAELTLPDGRTTLPATVDTIADRPGTNGLDSQHVYVRLRPEQNAPGLKDASVRVSFEIASTAGEVTVVPVAAVTARADGTSVVERLEADGTRSVIRVKAGLSASGYVEVAAIEGTIAPGERVIVGQSEAGASG